MSKIGRSDGVRGAVCTEHLLLAYGYAHSYAIRQVENHLLVRGRGWDKDTSAVAGRHSFDISLRKE